MSEIAQLRARIDELRDMRRKEIEHANSLIDSANSLFDDLAVPLMRRLDELQRHESRRRLPVRHAQYRPLDGLTEEERAHFRELQKKRAH